VASGGMTLRELFSRIRYEMAQNFPPKLFVV
jgi:hypothetical protein